MRIANLNALDKYHCDIKIINSRRVSNSIKHEYTNTHTHTEDDFPNVCMVMH